jgi:chromosome segregation ATPase
MNTETLKSDINKLLKKCVGGRYELSDADRNDLVAHVKTLKGEVYRVCSALLRSRRESKEAVEKMRNMEHNLMRTQGFYSDQLHSEMEEKNRVINELKHELDNADIRLHNLEEYNNRLSEENKTLEKIRRSLEYGNSWSNS